MRNQKNSTEVRGSGNEETNTRACLERVNVPKSLILEKADLQEFKVVPGESKKYTRLMSHKKVTIAWTLKF